MSVKKTDKSKELAELSLEELILDKARGKYDLVLLASGWAKEVRRMEEFRHLTQVELIEKSLHDAISGVITWDKLEKLQAKAGSAKELDAKDREKEKEKSKE